MTTNTKPELHEYRITFGLKYAREQHPWPLAHPDGWVTITAPDENAARRSANTWLRPWAFLYGPTEPMDPDLFPRGELYRISVEDES